jgi:hypothetical protein
MYFLNIISIYYVFPQCHCYIWKSAQNPPLIEISERMMKIYLILLVFISLLLLHPSKSIPRKRPTVAIACLLKDNEDILPFWLEYHSNLVGVGNIVMLDNFSSKKSATPKILKEWEAKGLKVEWKQGPYHLKGDLTMEAFRKHFPRHDIGIPLDIDEIITANTDGRPNITRAAFHQSIDQLKMYSRPCVIFNNYDHVCSYSVNDTIHSVNSVYALTYDNANGKKMFHLPAALGLDHGNHRVHLAGGKCHSGKNLFGLIHYHSRNPKLTLEHALDDIRGFDHIGSEITVQNVHEYKEKLEYMVARNVAGKHKAQEALRYIEHGYEGLVIHCDPTKVVYIGNISTILENM